MSADFNFVKKMGNIFKLYFDESSGQIYCCKYCYCHFTSEKNIVSTAFNGHFGKAYLVDLVLNVFEGTYKETEMSSGSYVVCDIFCVQCRDIVGWKYRKSYQIDQKYKEGKYVLEVTRIRQE